MKYKLLVASILTTLSTPALSAAYTLEELGTLEGAKLSYVSDVSESGYVIGSANGLYNLPIDVSYIDFEDSLIESAYQAEENAFERIDKEITFTLDDIENNNAVATNPDAHAFMVSFLSSQASNPNYQNLASLVGTQYDRGEVTEQVIFDVESEDYDGLTRSVSNLYNAISEDGVVAAWGSAPYVKTQFTPEDETEEETYFVRDFISRAMVISNTGVKVPLAPDFADFGGISTATDIKLTPNGDYIVVGSVSTGIPEDRQENIDENCDVLERPISTCVETIDRNPGSNPTFNDRIQNGIFDKQAVKWTLDASLNVKSTELLGLGLTPEEDDGFAFSSNAMAVNSKGTVVGQANVRYFENNDTILDMPVYYKDGEVVEYIDQEDDWFSGKSLAINENNVIVGYAQRQIENSTRSKFFYHDIASNSTVFPTDFFSSSSSYAHDVNDNGFIVGEGETDITSSQRRREGFLYQIGDDSIVNINDLLPCYESDGETRFKYVVAEARQINNDNEIFGVATKTVEKRDTLGGIVTDIEGNTEYESVAVAVKLTPTGEEADSCTDPETEAYERQSGSFSWLSLLLIPLVGLRRRFK
ncbi:MAG: DUF3466 family protein [Pseudoalteromonas sp.]